MRRTESNIMTHKDLLLCKGFPMAAGQIAINSAVYNNTGTTYTSGGQKSELDLTGWNQSVSRVVLLSGGFREEPVFLSSPGSRGSHLPWLRAPPSMFKASDVLLSVSRYTSSHSDSSASLFLIYGPLWLYWTPHNHPKHSISRSAD